jgi:hypothetical protein
MSILIPTDASARFAMDYINEATTDHSVCTSTYTPSRHLRLFTRLRSKPHCLVPETKPLSLRSVGDPHTQAVLAGCRGLVDTGSLGASLM